MEPFYFGASDAPLFGIYHRPASRPLRDVGVLLCYPSGHEYIVSHRAYRQLSIRLAEAGFPVLRFDYYASGDSGGDCEHGSPGRWLVDISTAIGELRLRSGARRVCLMGCRLGGTLAALVGADRGDIGQMVLWDPISNGRTYINEITRRQHEMLRRSHVRPPAHRLVDTREFLGFAVRDTTVQEIEAIDLLTLRQPPAQDVLFVESNPEETVAELREHVRTLNARVTHQHIPIRNAWTWVEDISATLVPHQILNLILSWIVRTHP